MTRDCTILIPTHNRHHYLKRCLQWFLEFGYPIVIADSSARQWESELRRHPSITYIWHPGGFDCYLPKLKMALDTIATPYMAMCADDDFILHEGIRKAVAFLEDNPDYSFAQGYSYLYQVFGARAALWPLYYPSRGAFQDDWMERVAARNDTIYYGVNRTAHLKKAVEFLVRQDFSGIVDSAVGFFDFALTSTVARQGKLKRLPVPFGLREYSPLVSAVGTRYRTIVTDKVARFYDNLIDFLSEGDRSEATRTALQRVCARDYAGQLSYDESISGALSRKRRLAFLPPAALPLAEELFRYWSALRLFLTSDFFPALGVFAHPEYPRFRALVTKALDPVEP
ncbi:MAG: TIGR00180 family glycosyltransferase [Rhodospirillaceae bacterium]